MKLATKFLTMYLQKVGRKGLKKYQKFRIKPDTINPFKEKMVAHPLAGIDPRYKGATIKVNKI